MTDAELLKAWRAGDRSAGDRLAQRYYTSVLRFFEFRTNCPQDLTQRVFLAAVEGRGRVVMGSSFRAYLFGIARNLLAAYLREKARTNTLASFADEPAPGPGLTTLVAIREEQHLLLRALAGASAQTQVLLGLHCWEGLSAVELAEVFEIPPSTVRTQLWRARAELRERIRDVASERVRLAIDRDLDGWLCSLVETVNMRAQPKMPRVANRRLRRPGGVDG